MPAYNPNAGGRVSHFQRVLTTNSTDTDALTSPADATTEPAADGTDNYFKADSGHLVVLMPIGTNAADETAIMQVYGVRKIAGSGTRWTHEPIAEFDLIFGAGATGETTEFYCDSIVLSNGPSLADEVILSPLSDFAEGNATATFHNKGYEFLFFQWDVTLATSVNCLVAIM